MGVLRTTVGEMAVPVDAALRATGAPAPPQTTERKK